MKQPVRFGRKHLNVILKNGLPVWLTECKTVQPPLVCRRAAAEDATPELIGDFLDRVWSDHMDGLGHLALAKLLKTMPICYQTVLDTMLEILRRGGLPNMS